MVAMIGARVRERHSVIVGPYLGRPGGDPHSFVAFRFDLPIPSSCYLLLFVNPALTISQPLFCRATISIFSQIIFQHKHNTHKMDPLPPNDPNRGNRGPGAGAPAAKEDPHDGRQRQRGGANGEIDMIGDLRDQMPVMALFLMGLASWILRERCVC